MENLNVLQEDNENNNVDENSNDHQFMAYANIHEQYGQHNYYHNENESQHQRADHEQAVRESVYRRLNAGRRVSIPTDVVDRNSYLQDNSNSSNQPVNIIEHNSTPGHFIRMNGAYQSVSSRCQQLTMTGRTDPSYQISQDIQNEAEELFNNFTLEQFRSEDVDTQHLGLQSRPFLTNPHWAKAGQDLRQLADAFSKSRERNELRRKAHLVNMSSISMNDFFHLCAELFQGSGGITQERIVVLFTFISDVAIQHVRIRAEQFIQRLLSWSLRFIFERICAWVQDAGGWAIVLSTGTNLLFKISLSILASLGIVALGLYIVKTVKEL